MRSMSDAYFVSCNDVSWNGSKSVWESWENGKVLRNDFGLHSNKKTIWSKERTRNKTKFCGLLPPVAKATKSAWMFLQFLNISPHCEKVQPRYLISTIHSFKSLFFNESDSIAARNCYIFSLNCENKKQFWLGFKNKIFKIFQQDCKKKNEFQGSRV